MQNIFGSGQMWATPLTDNTGTAIANPTPVMFGVSQDIAADVQFDLKLLHGQNQFSIAAGRGKGKIAIKVKAAQVNAMIFNNLLFGTPTFTSGIIADYYDTTGAVVPGTPWTITVVPPSSGVFAADLGVRNGTSGQNMTRVAAAPTTGQYSVTVGTGAYLFAAADVTNLMFISYQYTATSTTAKKGVVLNVPMGYAPSCKIDVSVPYNGKSLIWTFPNCVIGKMGTASGVLPK